jgi:L-ribulokinase
MESMSTAISAAAATAGKQAARVAAVSIDTTGSTPCPVDGSGRPLAFLDGFRDDPDAMSIMWKDHTSQAEAEEITARARTWKGKDYLQFCGGEYSAEWYWAKVLHVLRRNRKVAEAAAGWLEHCDWITALLCGQTGLHGIARSACAAGHKALWNRAFGGYPAVGFFATVDTCLLPVLHSQIEPKTSDKVAGHLDEHWARRLGLPAGIPLGVGLFDAHAGAIGAGVRPGTVVKVMGTSSSEMIVAAADSVGDRAIPGIESQAMGSMVPGLIGIEAGQSAFGDVYAWFRDLLAWPLHLACNGNGGSVDKQLLGTLIPELSRRAELVSADKDRVDAEQLVATDWFNGRRAPFANHTVTGSITGLTLGTKPEQIFHALVEATAFGTRAIHELLRNEGVPIERVLAVGGIPKKAPYVMQVLADVLETPVLVSGVDNGSARGAAILASVVAGAYPDVESAIKVLGGIAEKEYLPRDERLASTRKRYERYLALGRFSEQTPK